MNFLLLLLSGAIASLSGLSIRSFQIYVQKHPLQMPFYQVLSMGIGSIMGARKILMVVNGKGKAEIVKKAFFGPVTPEVPASVLQLHPDFTLVADEDALSLI